MKKQHQLIPLSRHMIVLGGMLALVLVLIWRAVDLQVMSHGFLQQQGDARAMRTQNVAAHRGMITDRNGEPLAISTPVDSIWANPKVLLESRKQWPQLAKMIGLKQKTLESMIERRRDRAFIYLKRHVNPDLAQQVMAMEVPGVSLQREYRRYYPAGEVTAHVVGFTNIDDVGQEGMELAFDELLRGTAGKKRVLKDRLGRVVEDVESISEPVPGDDLRLSIDRRIQYLAYRELKTAVKYHGARSGSVVILDARTGEVLAMVNQPAYNPNNRKNLRSENYRNRAVTDVIEPGSTVKPFAVAAALEAGTFQPRSIIDTNPGYMRVDREMIRDTHNYGWIDVTKVIQKSSNVGISKIALSLEPEQMWTMFSSVGFGSETGSQFPGEVSGSLSDYWRWHDFEQATLAFGYGIAATPLQIAQSYTALADQGRMKPVSFLAIDEPAFVETVMRPETSTKIVAMLETVVTNEGTARRARVSGYRVAGKTGTVKKFNVGGYAEKRYVAIFAGLAPASDPRLVMAVVIDEPSGKDYYGGVVAAPVFANVMSGALRLLGIVPDDLTVKVVRQPSSFREAT